jgi:hypothetical protein
MQNQAMQGKVDLHRCSSGAVTLTTALVISNTRRDNYRYDDYSFLIADHSSRKIPYSTWTALPLSAIM